MHQIARPLLLSAALLLDACAATPRETPAAGLERLVEEYFDRSLALNPMYATWIGENRYDDQLEMTATPEYEAATTVLEARYRDAVAAIDPATLDEDARLTREVFLYSRDRTLERNRHPSRLLPISQFDGGMATAIALFGAGGGAQPFATAGSRARASSRAGWTARSRRCARAWRKA